jgi:hypothetical protein
MKNQTRFYTRFCSTLCATFAFCLAVASGTNVSLLKLEIGDTTKLPKVFIIGEYEKTYDAMALQHQASLLTVCNDDINVAFKLWLGMLQDVQVFANKANFDLKGAKFWINVFYAPSGSIDHIAYYLKPTSRNIAEKEMKTFLTSFISQFKLPHTWNTGFSHFGHASFPILPETISN